MGHWAHGPGGAQNRNRWNEAETDEWAAWSKPISGQCATADISGTNRMGSWASRMAYEPHGMTDIGPFRPIPISAHQHIRRIVRSADGPNHRGNGPVPISGACSWSIRESKKIPKQRLQTDIGSKAHQHDNPISHGPGPFRRRRANGGRRLHASAPGHFSTHHPSPSTSMAEAGPFDAYQANGNRGERKQTSQRTTGKQEYRTKPRRTTRQTRRKEDTDTTKEEAKSKEKKTQTPKTKQTNPKPISPTKPKTQTEEKRRRASCTLLRG